MSTLANLFAAILARLSVQEQASAVIEARITALERKSMRPVVLSGRPTISANPR
jgi:hypothetical protein